MQRIRFAYFGWAVEFSSAERSHHRLRQIANGLLLAEHGPDPKPLGYVEPGLPFPDFVRGEVWDGEAGWQPYL